MKKHPYFTRGLFGFFVFFVFSIAAIQPVEAQIEPYPPSLPVAYPDGYQGTQLPSDYFSSNPEWAAFRDNPLGDVVPWPLYLEGHRGWRQISPFPSRRDDLFGNFDLINPRSRSGTIAPYYDPRLGNFQPLLGTSSTYVDAYCRTAFTSGDSNWDDASPFYDDMDWDPDPEWREITVDLSDFAGLAVSISWYFDAGDDYYNQHEGWYLDDIEIGPLQQQSNPLPTDIFGDSYFTSGAENRTETDAMLVYGLRNDNPTISNPVTYPYWQPTDVRHASGSHSWWFGNPATGTYAAWNSMGDVGDGTGCRDRVPAGAHGYGRLMTPVIELGVNPTLTFQTLWAIESAQPDFRDMMRIDVAIDRDRDGIIDFWEQGHAIDLDGNGEISPVEVQRAPLPNSNPDHKNLYVELDCMDHPVHPERYCLSSSAYADLQTAYGAIPITNPDGSIGITLHVDSSGRVTYDDNVNRQDVAAFRNNNFDQRRLGIFHYGVVAPAVTGDLGYPAGGFGVVNGDFFALATYPYFTAPIPSRDESLDIRIEHAFFHEMGHNLGLNHGGEEDINYMPHYFSIMNYHYDPGFYHYYFEPFVEHNGNNNGVCDPGESCRPELRYSYETLGILDEDNLNELLGIPNITHLLFYQASYYCSNPARTLLGDTFRYIPYLQTSFPAGEMVDWNCNNRLDLLPVRTDVNRTGTIEELESNDDRPLIDLIFGDNEYFHTRSAYGMASASEDERLRSSGDPTADTTAPLVSVSGRSTSSGNPTLEITLTDPVPPTYASGLRLVRLTGNNVVEDTTDIPKEPLQTSYTFSVASTDGNEPEFELFVEDYAGNAAVFRFNIGDLQAPVCELAGVTTSNGQTVMSIVATDNVRLNGAAPTLLENADFLDYSGDPALTRAVLRFVKLDEAQPMRVDLTIPDVDFNETNCSFTDADSIQDTDSDGVSDRADNCPLIANTNQADGNSDGVGDACSAATVPDLRGMSQSQAENALQSAGFTTGIVGQTISAIVPAGQVVVQNPLEGSSFPPGTPVDFNISSGVILPDLTGLAQAQAETILYGLQLTPGTITTANSDTVPIGAVISHTPPSGTSANIGDSVDLVVSVGRSITVPDVVGLSQTAAESVLQSETLIVGAIAYTSSAQPADSVVLQTPSAGTIVNEGATVDLVLSLGDLGQTTVPDVVGLLQADAQTAITNVNLFIRTTTTISSAAPAGTVLDQSPPAGTVVDELTGVDITVSLGDLQQTTVPDVVGLLQADAQTAITNANLFIQTTTTINSIAPAGTVLDQSPPSGTLVEEFTGVDITVSLGGLTLVPDVVGLSQANAETAILNANLTVGNISQQISATVPAGDVIRQTPLPNTEVNIGNSVDLVISSGSGTTDVTVPDLIGLTEAQANTALQNVGLNLGTIVDVVTTQFPADTIMAQQPLAGTTVPPGSTVSVEIARQGGADIRLTRDCPDTVEMGEYYVCTLTYENVGASTATNLNVYMTVPPNTIFASATQGGIYNVSGPREIRWSVPDLPAGESAQVSTTVGAFCSPMQEQWLNYRATYNNPSSVVIPPMTETVDIVIHNRLPVSISVDSVGENGNLVSPGDIITHTITLTNDENTEHRNLLLRLGAGNSMVFDQVIDTGGLSLYTLSNGAYDFRGTLAANSSTQIVLTTHVQNALPITLAELILNNGLIRITTGCGAALGQTNAPSLPIMRPVSMNIVALNLPDLGASDNGVPGLSGADILQVAHPESTLQIEWRIQNETSNNLPTVRAEIQLPTDVTPLNLPAGVVQDATSGALLWTGALAGDETHTLVFDVDYAGTECRSTFNGTVASNGTDVDSLRSLSILTAPPVDSDPYLVGTESSRGLWYLSPTGQRVPMMCVIAETSNAVSFVRGGNLFVTGLPSYRINPLTLEFEFMDFNAIAGMTVRNVANNLYGNNGDAYFIGTNSVVRFNTYLRQTTLIFSDPSFNFDGDAFVDLENRLVLASGTQVIRIDLNGAFPVDPTNAEVFDVTATPSVTLPGTIQQQRIIPIGVNTNGDYLLSLNTISIEPIFPNDNGYYEMETLLAFNRVTGITTVVHDVMMIRAYRQSNAQAIPLPPELTPVVQFNPLLTLSSYRARMVSTLGDVYVSSSQSRIASVGVIRNGQGSILNETNTGTLITDMAWFEIVAGGGNNIPVANNSSVSTPQEMPVNVTLSGFDVDGDTLTYTVLTQPQSGNLTGTPPALTYIPNIGFFGVDTFTFEVSDGQDVSNTATVTITVNEVIDPNNPPVAVDDSATTDGNQAVTIDVLINDSDADGDTLSVTNTTTPTNGSVVINPDNTLTYTPNLDFFGSDSFDYTLSDGTDSDTATVTITVNEVVVPNNPPVAMDDAATTDENHAVIIDVLTNDSDADGDTLSVTNTTTPTNGSVVINPDNTLTYTPNAGFFGSDSFDYTLSDGTDSDTATVTVTVNEVVVPNNPPLAMDDAATTDENHAVIIDVLTNDSDADGDTLAVTSTTTPSNGSVVINPDNTLTYTPNLDFFGSDSFDYTLSDGTDSDTATVTVTVNEFTLAECETVLVQGRISTNGMVGTLTYIGSETACELRVGIASYKNIDGSTETQLIYDYRVVDHIFTPNQPLNLTITVPQCAAQVDLFYGNVIQPTFGSQRYGTRLIAARHLNGTGFCEDPSAPPLPVCESFGALHQEAEDGLLSNAFVINQDNSASNGQYISAPEGSGNSFTVNRTRSATYCFDVPEAGIYQIIGRVLTPNSSSDSFFVSINGGVPFIWDVSGGSQFGDDPVNDRLGEDPVLVTLPAGGLTVTLYVREDGTRLDTLEVMRLSEPETCSGLAEEAENAIFEGAFVIGNDNAASGDHYIHIPNGAGHFYNINYAHSATYCFTVPVAGDYHLRGWVYAANDTSDSFFVSINHATPFVWDVLPNSRYLEDDIRDRSGHDPVVVSLPAGEIEVVIYAREDGTRLDRLELVQLAEAQNQAPHLLSPGTLSNTVSESVSVEMDVIDDGTNLTFSAVGLPDGLAIDPETGHITGTIAPNAIENSPFVVMVTVSDDGEPALTDEVTFGWTIVDEPQQSSIEITGFTLINARTDQVIESISLEDGASIDIDDLPDAINIRVETNPQIVGSVYISLSGAASQNRTENTYPYAVFSDTNGNYANWTPIVGDYLLVARPYTDSNRQGSEGIDLSIQFTITD